MPSIMQVIFNSSLEFSLIGVAVFSLIASLFQTTTLSRSIKNLFLTILTLLIITVFAFHLYYHTNIIDVLLLFSCLCIIYLHTYYHSSKITNFSVYFLVISAFIGTLFAIRSKDFLSLYLAFEIISFIGYIIVALLQKKILTSESAMKYFIIGGISSAIMLFGISFIYGGSNSIEFYDIKHNTLVTIGIIMFLCGIFFKLTAFPFHFWAPDVYSTTSLPSLSIITILPKVAALLALSNIIPYIQENIILTTITMVAIASMIIGSVGGIFQNHIQKILAYSGIANIGFILTVFITPIFTKTVLIEFITIYSISVLFFITVLMSIRKNFTYNGTISSIQGLYKTNPYLAFLLSFSLLNLAGIPPLSGFFAKYIIIKNLMLQANFYIPIIIVTTSAIGLFYYLKIIKNIYFNTPQQNIELSYHSFKTSLLMKVYIIAMFLFVLLYFVFQTSTTYQHLIQSFIG
jgi:NADH-quinone oxidoreductase subunit N